MVSSPLILGLDITDSALVDSVWPIVSNKEAIAVNQAWAGHPGRLVAGTPSTYQVWAKKLPNNGQAVLVINHGGSPVDVSVTLASVGIGAASAAARDVWAHKDLGTVSGTWEIKALASHDSAFAVFSV